MKKLRILCFLLTLLVFLPMLAACNGKGDGSETNAGMTETGPADMNGLPLADFGLKAFTILSREGTDYEFSGDGAASDRVDEEIIARNTNVEAAYNVEINLLTEAGEYDQSDIFIDRVRTEAMAGGDGISLISTHSSYIQSMAIEGLGFNVYDVPYIDPAGAWWCKQYVDICTVDNRSFALIGDITISLYEYMEVCFYNKSVAEDLASEYPELQNLPQLALDYNWTMEKMFALSNAAISINDSDNSINTYGLIINGHALSSIPVAMNVSMAKQDADGKFYFPKSTPAELISLFDDVLTFCSQNGIHYPPKNASSTNAEEGNEVFINNDALFYLQIISEAASFNNANMETASYGVLPFPKAEEGTSTPYYSTCRVTLSAVMFPASGKNPEMMGLITEALCRESRELIVPVYWEDTLKFRYLSDPEVAKVLDLIRDSLTFDFCQVYTKIIAENPYLAFWTCMSSNIVDGEQTSINTYYLGRQVTWQLYLDKMIYDKLATLE
ncbi:MAG: extracellular solute-binding protein [Clostridia bacterium]|nr:extracellular solute-binding protein [Clostridia bacterium]